MDQWIKGFDPWPIDPSKKFDPFDSSTHDPSTHCQLWRVCVYVCVDNNAGLSCITCVCVCYIHKIAAHCVFCVFMYVEMPK